jgi:poly-beta-hydroxyalkanoate depolymerase
MKHRSTAVDLSAIRRLGVLTVEDENDDIFGVRPKPLPGRTSAKPFPNG